MLYTLKFYTTIVSVVITALVVGSGFYFQIENLKEENIELKAINKAHKDEPTTETNTGFATYTSDSLGLIFSYPSVSAGKIIEVKEDGNRVSLWESGKTSSSLAGIEVVMIDVPSNSNDTAERLSKVLLKSSNTCSIELGVTTEEKEVYTFRTSVSPYESDEFDPNCDILTSIYYFPDQPNKVALVGSGQAPPFSKEDTGVFFNSIRLLPE